MIGESLHIHNIPFLQHASIYNLAILLSVSVVLTTLAYIFITEHQRAKSRIPNIPSPPGLPVVGNLHQLGPDPAETLHQWGKQYGGKSGIYQISMGNMPVVVFDRMQAARDVFIGQGNAVVDRPRFYTFHKVLSSVASSIGTNSWNDNTKRRRKVAASAMNRPATASYLPWIDELTKSLVSDLLAAGKDGQVAFSPRDSLSHAILDLTMTIHYGTRLPAEPALFSEILEVEDGLSRIKSPLGSNQDYVPALRWMPWLSNSAKAREINRRRLAFLTRFDRELEERIAVGTEKSSIAANALKDPEAKLDRVDLMSLSMSMVSGGLDTMVNTMAWTIGTLAHRPDIQDKAYAAIHEVYGSQSWGDIEDEAGVPYIHALMKECLRTFSVLRLSLPRAAYKDIHYGDVVIPKGTTLFLNAWGCNRDESFFGPDVETFRPERYLDDPELPHAAYGFGTRMCAGFQLANRQLYILLLRLIWAFKIEMSEREADRGWTVDPLDDVTEPFHLAAIPPSYKVRLVPRHAEALREMLGAK